jgi:hypothetical protein
MPELIYETVVTTVSPAGAVHIAPMGVRYVGDAVVLMPFRPSTTLANIEASGRAVLNLLTDVRVFAGCVTGHRHWPTVALPDLADDAAVDPAGAGAHDLADNPAVSRADTRTNDRPVLWPADQRLAAALGHEQLRLIDHNHDPQRPVLHLRRAAAAQHGRFAGMNRAQAAVVEGAVLVSRLFMLPRAKVESEWTWLQIAIDKTAGPAELEAWGWLDQAVRQHLASLDAASVSPPPDAAPSQPTAP